MKKIFIIIVLSLLAFFNACENKNKKYHIPYIENTDEIVSSDVISVPFKDDGDVKTVQVKINDCAEFPMILDTGCSGLLISILEVYVLAKQGCLTADDIEGYAYSQIADGSIVENMVINLKEIKIGDLVCHNVKAFVSDNGDVPLLLGNGVLNEVETMSINNFDCTVDFKLK